MNTETSFNKFLTPRQKQILEAMIKNNKPLIRVRSGFSFYYYLDDTPLSKNIINSLQDRNLVTYNPKGEIYEPTALAKRSLKYSR